ncbi:MAG: tRNA uridine-5-carboxymethylaminomethyl(34) synthesis GTPase MnmE [Lachnospiraceae bacterium]|nr:tRNA uridine-5-carboxymethylaminomethyl(34) synthesis GTPase MnmE [Lachnospiraceae bacterium]
MKTDTIVAIATALSDSGIGIIRVSGEQAIEIVNKIYVNKQGKSTLLNHKTHTIRYGYIIDCFHEAFEEAGSWKHAVIDEVMVAVMKAPHSYTAEDTVEINCHGGVLLLQKVLELIVKCGARIAQPGEFTKRAFLNGRIDLAKAEAVIDVIHSQNEFALKSSVNQLKGSVSEVVKQLREEIIYEIAFIESALDDPEHISLDGYEERLQEKTEAILKQLQRLIASADNGKLMKEGINTVIVGKPNVGKSSLLNRLVGEERAIVTDIAGTTRDVLQESIKLHGIGLNMIDTAGIRNTEDVVEKIGVERAKEYAGKADLILYVVDASVPLDDSDREIISVIQEKKVIVLLNKSDLDMVVSEEKLLQAFEGDAPQIIKTSTKENTGIDEFEEVIKQMFFQGDIKANDEVIITNMRHKEALLDAEESLKMVMNSLENHMPEDFYSIDLMSAYASLGTIIGEEVGEDLVNEIFSKFCMGK